MSSRFPNALAVQAMFVKVVARVKTFETAKKDYVPLTDFEIDQMMAEALGPKK